MSLTRVVYDNQAAETGHRAGTALTSASCNYPWCVPEQTDYRVEKLRDTVQKALASLSELERSLIIRFYFQGQTYSEISAESGRAEYKLAALHKRALRKLRSRLAPFVRARFDIKTPPDSTCPVCRSVYRHEADIAINRRDRSRSWKHVIRLLRNRYGLNVRSAQTLISHEKYHRRLN